MKISEQEEPGLFLLGIELLDSAGQTLYETLEKQLNPLFGESWFSLSLVRNPEDREIAPRDLSALLVQIEIRNNSNFRLALRTAYNEGKPHDKNYFENLTDLRIIRNEWFHRIISPITTDELHDLCRTLVAVFPPETQIAIKAKTLNELLIKDTFLISDLFRISNYVGTYLTRIEEIEKIKWEQNELEEIMIQAAVENQTAMMEEIMKAEFDADKKSNPYVHALGDPFTGSLLPQKYTLKLDGNIVDRREGSELKEKLGERAMEIGQSLLASHPSGGRLRLSADGTVVGYDDEEWIVIGKIDLNNWFDT